MRNLFRVFALIKRRGRSSVTIVTIGVRANIHLGGGRPSFARMDSVGGGGSSRNFPGSIFSGGGGIFRDPYSVGGVVFFGIHILSGGTGFFR